MQGLLADNGRALAEIDQRAGFGRWKFIEVAYERRRLLPPKRPFRNLLRQFEHPSSSLDGPASSKMSLVVSKTAVVVAPRTITAPVFATSIRPALFSTFNPTSRVGLSMPLS
jgi:hypothetical protein